MREIDKLKKNISSIFSNINENDLRGSPESMRKVLIEVQRAFNSSERKPPERSIANTLLAFKTSGILKTFLDLKYACFGICQSLPPRDWKLIEDEALFQILLKYVLKDKGTPRKFQKYYLGLLTGYFDYPIFNNNQHETGLRNWIKLRAFLRRHIDITNQLTPVATSIKVLNLHLNLLEENPCAPYGQALLRGDDSDFNTAFNEIGISSESWIRQEIVRAYVKAFCELDDDQFKKTLKNTLTTLSRQTLADQIIISSVASLVQRYSYCENHPEHVQLRDAVLQKIGNPWLKREAWDAYVKNENARQMVNGWLKRRLIIHFFNLLSNDGAADERRLKYWLKFEPIIEDMWFALGPSSRTNHHPDFREFRDLAKGRLLTLEDAGNQDNNAFIMLIGKYLVVEFGVTGNACYVFDTESKPFDLEKSWVSCGRDGLKAYNNKAHLTHMHNWESRFDEYFITTLRLKPPAKVFTTKNRINSKRFNPPSGLTRNHTTFDDFITYLTERGIKVSDLRTIGGALWVETDNSNNEITAQLASFGFKYKNKYGWYIE